MKKTKRTPLRQSLANRPTPIDPQRLDPGRSGLAQPKKPALSHIDPDMVLALACLILAKKLHSAHSAAPDSEAPEAPKPGANLSAGHLAGDDKLNLADLQDLTKRLRKNYLRHFATILGRLLADWVTQDDDPIAFSPDGVKPNPRLRQRLDMALNWIAAIYGPCFGSVPRAQASQGEASPVEVSPVEASQSQVSPVEAFQSGASPAEASPAEDSQGEAAHGDAPTNRPQSPPTKGDSVAGPSPNRIVDPEEILAKAINARRWRRPKGRRVWDFDEPASEGKRAPSQDPPAGPIQPTDGKPTPEVTNAATSATATSAAVTSVAAKSATVTLAAATPTAEGLAAPTSASETLITPTS
ncbi:MAG: hypothetical protein LBJ61_11360, partial [Deltaproteobacteria bacterium]|nr:hypothetical protein [Deltaproteobacteria bacterium]